MTGLWKSGDDRLGSVAGDKGDVHAFVDCGVSVNLPVFIRRSLPVLGTIALAGILVVLFPIAGGQPDGIKSAPRPHSLLCVPEARWGDAHGATPDGNPGDWIHSDDYPLLAQLRGQTGRTQVVLDVGQNGLPMRCSISVSSGVTALDAEACSALMKRASFNPARDHWGCPRESTYRNWVRWRTHQG